MGGKKFIECNLIEIMLKYGESTLLTDIEKIFNDIREKYKEYKNFRVDFDEWEGNYERGYDPYSKLCFHGERIETDDEYQQRLKEEVIKERRRIEEEKKEKERQKILDAQMEEFDKKTFERLRIKYGW